MKYRETTEKILKQRKIRCSGRNCPGENFKRQVHRPSTARLRGTAIPLSEVKDATFASEVLGRAWQ